MCVSDDSYVFSLAGSIPLKQTTSLMVGTLLLGKRKSILENSLRVAVHPYTACGPLCGIFIVLATPSSLGWWERIDDMIKTRLGECSEASDLPWPKAPSTVLP